MTIAGKVVDANTGNALSTALIQIVNLSGIPQGVSMTAGVDGSFAITNPAIDNNYVLVSNTGYVSTIYDPTALTSIVPTPIVGLSPASLPAQGAYNESAPAGPPPAWLLPGLLILAVLSVVFFTSGKKKKKGKMTGGAADFIIPIGVVVGGYFVLTYVFQKLGLGPGKIDTSKSAADTTASNTQKAAAGNIPAGANRNMADTDLLSIATQLTDTTSGVSYDYDTMASMLAYFAAFTNADAIMFLADFVTVNTATLYQWYRDKIAGASDLFAGDLQNSAQKYAANWATMGVDPSSISDLGVGVDNFVNGCVSYVYTVAGEAKT